MSPRIPRIVPRSQHTISRKRIDPNALKVMYRLHRAGFKGYLCGGGVRDLLLARRPKDFDIATDARPHEVKTLFRNSRIIGRRFKITQVYFKDGTIVQVSTFRSATEFIEPPASDAGPSAESAADAGGDLHPAEEEAIVTTAEPERSLLIRRDNVYGTPEEDAFRRDLTINGLFYDIGDFSIIDYVDGLADLQSKVIRIIGDPEIRIQEDPVRMIRAIRHATRLDFEIDPPTREAIVRHAARILECPAARVLDELYRDLRGGAAAPALRTMLALGVLDAMLPDLAEFLREGPPEEVERTWRGVEVLDATADYGDAPQAGVLWSVLAGTYLMHRVAESLAAADGRGDASRLLDDAFFALTRPLGVGRKDAERVKAILFSRRRLEQSVATGRLPKTLVHRPYYEDALSYFDMVTRAEGGVVPGWLLAGRSEAPLGGAAAPGEEAGPGEPPLTEQPRRRRRRRRRGGRGRNPGAPAAAPAVGAELEAIVDTEPTDEDDEAPVQVSPRPAAPAADGSTAVPGAEPMALPQRSRRRRRRRRRPPVATPVE